MASTQINYTQGTPTDGIKYTLSMWVKRSNEGADSNYLASVWVDGSNHWCMRFITDQLDIYDNVSGSTTTEIKTTRKFRDPSAWYHIVYVYDSANVTAGDRQRLYVNGVEETIFDVDTNPSSSYASILNVSGRDLTFGARNSASYWDGCMSHINFCDGQAYAASDFGETDSTSGLWKIKATPSVTYGNNGFWLKMEDSSNLDLDSSGNSQSFTTTGNLTATKDNPSNNFSTWNPLVTSVGLDSPTFLNGNTFLQAASNTPRNYGVSSLAMPKTGKYFSEHKIVTNNDCIQFGICSSDDATASFQSNTPFSSTAYGMMYVCPEGKIEYNLANEITGLATAGNNDIVGLAIDMDDEKMYIYVNGTLANTGGTSFSGKVEGDFVYMCTGDGTTSGNDSVYSNFGNGYFGTTAITSAGTNASNNGLFEYDVPSGFGALCTKQIDS